MEDDKKIKKATIGPMPKGMFDDMPTVTVQYEDGSEEELFEYYPDELSFFTWEFQGLTRRQAFELRHKKDVAYLRS